MSELIYHQKTAKLIDIENHLLSCDALFTPKLSSYVNIHAYSSKITEKAITLEAWHQKKLIGLIAVYCNKNAEAFITNVSITKTFTGKGIAQKLLIQCIENAKTYNTTRISLEVHKDNANALSFYKKFGFEIKEQNSKTVNMLYNLEKTNG